MASDDAKPSFTLTYNKPTAKKIEYEDDDYEDEDDYIDQETGGGGFGFEQGTMKKKTVLAAANGRVAPPCCQVENCGVDLTNERYYRRHKVCQVHAKAPVVIVAGAQQRFCQQCSRFFFITLLTFNRKLLFPSVSAILSFLCQLGIG